MFSIFVLVSSMAFAAGPDCANIKSYKDFYLCSLNKHPYFEISNLKAKEGDALVDRAGQWENPEVAVKSVSGSNAGESMGSTEVSAAISVSQVWQRGAKVKVAEAEKKIANIESKESILTAKKSLIRDLYRLRQIDVESDLAMEAISTFEKIKRQYQGRRARGPEQEISLNLVELAVGDYELRKNHLAVEKSEISSKIKALWGPDFQVKKEFLPPIRSKWPGLVVKATAPTLELQRILAESEKASAEYTLAVREAFPNVSVGPTIERTTEGPNQYLSYGFNLAMTVPILSWNEGSRKVAQIKSEQALSMHKFASNRVELEKNILVEKYKSSVDSLLRSAKGDDVRKKHVRIDGLARQGLASSALVIEAHRQISEFTAAQHEHENTAIEAYLEVKTLSGEEIEGILE